MIPCINSRDHLATILNITIPSVVNDNKTNLKFLTIMSKKRKKQELSEGQERLLDLFAGINRWTTRGENKAFVFLSDGKECLLFVNKLEDLSRDMAMTVNHDPKMAAVFSMMAEDASILADSMREDISEWKEQYDSVQSYQQDDLPNYFFYGFTAPEYEG